jgi:hypothetical protein
MLGRNGARRSRMFNSNAPRYAWSSQSRFSNADVVISSLTVVSASRFLEIAR